MPDIQRDQHVVTASDDISDDVMAQILSTERAVGAWQPVISVTPIVATITRDHSDISWSDPVYGVTIRRAYQGVVLTRDFALAPF